MPRPMPQRHFDWLTKDRAVIALLLIAVAIFAWRNTALAAEKDALTHDLSLSEARFTSASRSIERLENIVGALDAAADYRLELAEKARADAVEHSLYLARLSNRSDERIQRLLAMARKPTANCETPPELMRELAGL